MTDLELKAMLGRVLGAQPEGELYLIAQFPRGGPFLSSLDNEQFEERLAQLKAIHGKPTYEVRYLRSPT